MKKQSATRGWVIQDRLKTLDDASFSVAWKNCHKEKTVYSRHGGIVVSYGEYRPTTLKNCLARYQESGIMQYRAYSIMEYRLYNIVTEEVIPGDIL